MTDLFSVSELIEAAEWATSTLHSGRQAIAYLSGGAVFPFHEVVPVQNSDLFVDLEGFAAQNENPESFRRLRTSLECIVAIEKVQG